jgi:hypothetical protein
VGAPASRPHDACEAESLRNRAVTLVLIFLSSWRGQSASFANSSLLRSA